MQQPWKDVFPAVATQLHRDESLNLDATSAHIEKLLACGVSGIIMLGSLGENTALEPDEKRTVMQNAIDTVAGRVPVLSCVAECSTATACRYARDMEMMGADGLMVLPAMVYRSDPDETIAHFRTVAGSVGLPIMVYNNPLSYGVDITPEMFAGLAEVPNLKAIKESSGDLRRITDLLNIVGDRYQIFTGVDDLALESAFLGAVGWVAGVGLAFPTENQAMWSLAMRGEWSAARDIYRWYMPLLHLDVGPKFVQCIKLAIQECGFGAEWVRAPRQVLNGAERERVLRTIHEGIDRRPAL